LTDRSKRSKINEIIAAEEGIAMASEVLITISKDEIEQARLMSEYKYELDTQSRLVEAKREGRREGQRKRDREIVRNARQLGIPVEQIARFTGLSEHQINELIP
jgi:predicted transposase/invertase (TIGR01784 family)